MIRIKKALTDTSLSVNGLPISLMVAEYEPRDYIIERRAYFVFGNPKETNIDELEEKRISKLEYVINTRDKFADFSAVFTKPKCRGRGLMTVLFRYAFREIRQKFDEIKCAYVRWDGRDEAAKRFYIGLGFEPWDSTKKLMRVHLDNPKIQAICAKRETDLLRG